MKYEGERQIVDLWLESFEEFLIGMRERDRTNEKKPSSLKALHGRSQEYLTYIYGLVNLPAVPRLKNSDMVWKKD